MVNSRPKGEQLINGALHGEIRHNGLNLKGSRTGYRNSETPSQKQVFCRGECELKQHISARFISITAELTVEWASYSRIYVTWQAEIVMIHSSPKPYLLSEISRDHFEKHHLRRQRGCRSEQSQIDANIIGRTRSTIGYVRGEIVTDDWTKFTIFLFPACV